VRRGWGECSAGGEMGWGVSVGGGATADGSGGIPWE